MKRDRNNAQFTFMERVSGCSMNTYILCIRHKDKLMHRYILYVLYDYIIDMHEHPG